MATEDLTTYTEVDPNNKITVTSDRSEFDTLRRNEDAYVYDDKGVDHFNGNFEHLFEIYMSSSNGIVVMWGMANIVEDLKSILDASEDELCLELSTYTFYLIEVFGGTQYYDTYGGTSGTLYYLTAERDEGVGTYGTLYLYIYSDADRTNLLDTLTVTLHEKEDFRYLYVTQSYNSGHTNAASGYTQNVDLQEVAGWANIAKVNGITATDLAKVRGIAVGDIAKRRGVAV